MAEKMDDGSVNILGTVFQELKEPFPASDIEWRVQTAGLSKSKEVYAKVLAYLTARAIEDRLDSVVGPMNWRDEYEPGPAGGVLCKLSIRIDGEWITKQDVADNTRKDAVKGGVSGALKRAAVKFGIGRYLYYLDIDWAEIAAKGTHYQPKDSKGKYPAFRWNPPDLPEWALPGGSGKPSEAVRAEMQKAAREIQDYEAPEVKTALNNPKGRGLSRTKLINRIMVHVNKLPTEEQELWIDKINETSGNEDLVALGLEVKAHAEKMEIIY